MFTQRQACEDFVRSFDNPLLISYSVAKTGLRAELDARNIPTDGYDSYAVAAIVFNPCDNSRAKGLIAYPTLTLGSSGDHYARVQDYVLKHNLTSRVFSSALALRSLAYPHNYMLVVTPKNRSELSVPRQNALDVLSSKLLRTEVILLADTCTSEKPIIFPRV